MLKLKKVLVVTDSLGLPRDYPEEVDFESCWPVLLKKHFMVHQVSIGGATIDQLWRQMAYHQFFNPDILILQSGIVDCAPRALSKIENDLINHFSMTRKLARKHLPKYNLYLRRKRSLTYTRLARFREYLLKFKSEIVDSNASIGIGITPGNEEYERKVPGIISNIKVYNAAIKDVFMQNYIDLNSIADYGLMTDNIHLNKKGHHHLYQEILNKLKIQE